MVRFVADDMLRLLRSIAHTVETGRVRQWEYDTRTLIAAVDAGYCRLVRLSGHQARFRDCAWDVFLGIELTSSGRIVAHS